MDFVIKNFSSFTKNIDNPELEVELYSELVKLETLFEIIAKIHSSDEHYRICVENFNEQVIVRLRKDGLIAYKSAYKISDSNTLGIGIHQILYIYSTLDDKSVDFSTLKLSKIEEKYGSDYNISKLSPKLIEYKIGKVEDVKS